MGLLDEAIRDHLELKRRHGADPGELARLEQEALGPARREAAPPAGGAEESAPGEGEPLGDEPERGEPDAHEADAREPDAYEPTDEDERVEALVEDEEPIYDDELLGEQDEPAAAGAAGEPPPPASSVDQPTVQFDVREADEQESAGGERGHDELEDTPEFLQETPEHDRLWFEQKPPKDFDF
jgi:hypothetical protein